MVWHLNGIGESPFASTTGRERGLPSEPQGFDDASVALDVVVLHIVQKSPATADHHQKSPAGMMILFMGFQVFGQV